MAGTTFPFAARALALIAGAALVGACGGATPPPPPPVRIMVNDAAHELPPGITFGGAIERLGIQAHTGRLLSVGGAVLNRFADPGRILLNGSRAPRATRLSTGDQIVVDDGHDRTEGTRRLVADIGRRLGNPERTLATYRTRRTTISGRVSGEIVSITDESRGRAKTPRAVALTFDDGPWPGDTERVLAVLKRYHVPATFFMVGNLAERYPDLVAKVVKRGHQIGNHSFDHPVSPALAELTDEDIVAEIADASAALTKAGIRPTLFRPPGGSFDDFVVQEARREGMRVVLWSVDPRDWRAARTKRQIVHSILRHVKPGSIILLHDGGGDAAHTIDALPKIIRGIRHRGLRFVTIPPQPV